MTVARHVDAKIANVKNLAANVTMAGHVSAKVVVTQTVASLLTKPMWAVAPTDVVQPNSFG